MDVTEQLVPDDTWWTQHVIFKGNHIRILINGTEVVNFVDADDTHTNGYFALQQFYPGHRRAVSESDDATAGIGYRISGF